MFSITLNRQSLFIMLLLLICYSSVSAQKESAIWYFGGNAGLDFNQRPVKVLTDGALNAEEGCASISDGNGKLLFYSDGNTVWNRKHLVMENGTGLYGNSLSTQSAVIIPCPENNHLYYFLR